MTLDYVARAEGKKLSILTLKFWNLNTNCTNVLLLILTDMNQLQSH
jgi:hypothetical protein